MRRVCPVAGIRRLLRATATFCHDPCRPEFVDVRFPRTGARKWSFLLTRLRPQHISAAVDFLVTLSCWWRGKRTYSSKVSSLPREYSIVQNWLQVVPLEEVFRPLRSLYSGTVLPSLSHTPCWPAEAGRGGSKTLRVIPPRPLPRSARTGSQKPAPCIPVPVLFERSGGGGAVAERGFAKLRPRMCQLEAADLSS